MFLGLRFGCTCCGSRDLNPRMEKGLVWGRGFRRVSLLHLELFWIYFRMSQASRRFLGSRTTSFQALSSHSGSSKIQSCRTRWASVLLSSPLWKLFLVVSDTFLLSSFQKFFGSSNQRKLWASRVSFKSQLELELSSSVFKDFGSYQEDLLTPLLQMISLALRPLCPFWTVIQTKEQSMPFSRNRSSFQNHHQLGSGQHQLLQKVSFSLNSGSWRSQPKTSRARIELRITRPCYPKALANFNLVSLVCCIDGFVEIYPVFGSHVS